MDVEMESPTQVMERLRQEGIDAERRNEERKRAADEEAKVVRLPVWPEGARSVPNGVLRGSLFAAIQDKSAKYVKKMVLHNSELLEIKFTGQRLTQTDLEVWEQALHMSKSQCLGNKVYFKRADFLKYLDRGTGARQYEWLDSVLTNLSASSIAITHMGMKYVGSLIQEYYQDEETGEYYLVINPKIARLYDAGHTYINVEKRRAIGKRRPLAQWLYGYISTHRKWYPHKLETLKDLSGSNTKEVRKFKQSLKNALAHLSKINLIRGFSIDKKGLVHIEH